MTPAAFTQWLAAMRTANIAPNDKACAAALGVTQNALVDMKRRGANRRTALACAALLAGMRGYGDALDVTTPEETPRKGE